MQSYNDSDDELIADDGMNEADSADWHALRTAPVLTGDALVHCGLQAIPQHAVYGRLLEQHSPGFPLRSEKPKLYINTNAPFSALVCGVQGSGKSHSTSVILESCLIKDSRIGTLPEPLSALVFHFDVAAGGGLVQPCEAAYLAAMNPARAGSACAPPVKVLVMPNSIKNMRRVYAGLPGVSIEPLHFSPEDINGSRLLSMMKLADGQQLPLYMEALMNILRSMEDDFNYSSFRDELDKQKFNPMQKMMLNLRLALLDSCLLGGTAQNSVKNHFVQGQLTIIDLSSPFMDPTSACGFFDLILGLFTEVDCAPGKIVVLDEAHKYLSESSSRLTESLLTVIRQQRHLATRVVISTQEPTVVPVKFLDLCSFIIAHRFSSPAWLQKLAGHVSAETNKSNDLFTKIVALRTGERIMFAPAGLARREEATDEGAVAPLGKGYWIIKSRLRITCDGGQSLLAVKDALAPLLAHATACAQAADKSGIETPPESSTEGSPKPALATPLASVPALAIQLHSAPEAATATQLTSGPQPPPKQVGSLAVQCENAASSTLLSSTTPESSSELSWRQATSHGSPGGDINVTCLVAWLRDEERVVGNNRPISGDRVREGMVARGAVISVHAKNALFERAARMGVVKTWNDEAGKRWVQLV